MRVEVRLFAAFRKGRFKTAAVDVREGARLMDVLDELDIPAENVSLPLINGRYSRLDDPLALDDVVALFPAVAGG